MIIRNKKASREAFYSLCIYLHIYITYIDGTHALYVINSYFSVLMLSHVIIKLYPSDHMLGYYHVRPFKVYCFLWYPTVVHIHLKCIVSFGTQQ